MTQREYRITVHSISRFMIAIIVILCSSLILIIDYTPQIENKFLSLIQFLSIFITSFYLAHLLGRGKVKVLFTDEGFIHIWERRFLFSRERNFNIPWDLIDNYVFQKDRTFDSFIINLTIKKRYKINQLKFLPLKDDFKKLIKEFPEYSNGYRQCIASNNNKTIKEGESIYESKDFKWIFFFMLGGFLILLFTAISNPELSSWDSIVIIGSAVLFYGLMIFKKRKKTNANIV